MTKDSLFAAIFFTVLYCSCTKNSNPVDVHDPQGMEASFYYQNPEGIKINDSVIDIPYPSDVNTFANNNQHWIDSLFKWVVYDSVSMEILKQSSTWKFDYDPYHLGTQIIKLYTYKEGNKAPTDSSSKIVHVTPIKMLKSINIDTLQFAHSLIPDTAKVGLYLKIYKSDLAGKRTDSLYYETGHIQNIANLSKNISLPVDTSLLLSSIYYKDVDPYVFVLYATYKGHEYELLGSDNWLVGGKPWITQASSADKSQTYEYRNVSLYSEMSILITSVFKYMSN